MRYLISFIIFITFSIPIIAFAKDGTLPATNAWNDSAGFQTSYDRLVKLHIAEAIERQNGGYYDQWQQNNTYNTTIGAQTTTIGAQTIFNDSNLSDLFITTSNCGELASSTMVDSSATNENSTNTSTTNGAPCKVKVNNANTH